jgi:iron complex transport system substrate-binding protein
VRHRVDEVAARAGKLPRVRVLFCLQLDPLIAAGRGTLPSELMEMAGGVNVVSTERYPRVGIETILAEAPEVIVQSRMDAPAPEQKRASLEFWQRWPTIPAVRDGRVFLIDGTTAFRAGPRIAEAIEHLSSLLHPDDLR